MGNGGGEILDVFLSDENPKREKKEIKTNGRMEKRKKVKRKKGKKKSCLPRFHFFLLFSIFLFSRLWVL